VEPDPLDSTDAERRYVAPLLATLHSRGFAAETCTMDRGYDVSLAYGSEDLGQGGIWSDRERTGRGAA
jgi:hypothetical protein